MPQLTAKINGREYIIPAADLEQIDLVETTSKHFHLLKDGQSLNCKVVEFNPSSKQITLEINGRETTVLIQDEVDQLVNQLGLSVVAAAKSNDAFAPMPGLVLDIMVQEGQKIEAGTPLLILEAMKMENVLKAEGEGVVKSITVNKGEAVEKKQLLIEIE